jgi:hypothetical protein
MKYAQTVKGPLKYDCPKLLWLKISACTGESVVMNVSALLE